TGDSRVSLPDSGSGTGFSLCPPFYLGQPGNPIRKGRNQFRRAGARPGGLIQIGSFRPIYSGSSGMTRSLLWPRRSLAAADAAAPVAAPAPLRPRLFFIPPLGSFPSTRAFAAARAWVPALPGGGPDGAGVGFSSIPNILRSRCLI